MASGFQRVRSFLRGVFCTGIFVGNTIFWCVFMLPLVVMKLLAPKGSQARWTGLIVRIADLWVGGNSWGIQLMHKIKWEVQGLEGLSPQASYLVVVNHQSWVDIVVLQEVLRRKVPFLRFFLKKELIYVPLLGVAWWALDYPFMHRHSNEYLDKHPERRGQDLEITRKACEKFRGSPVAILNFLEGTRCTPAKLSKSRSPYRNLLAPKRGGVAFALQSMGEQFEALLDVTIFYPKVDKTLWDLLSGQIDRVVVRVRKLPIPQELIGHDNLEKKENRATLRNWIHGIWEEKDRWIESQKTLMVLFALSGVLTLSSCTQEAKVKDASLAAAAASFENILKDESHRTIRGKELLKLNYISVIKEQSHFEVVKATIQKKLSEGTSGIKNGDNRESAVVQVRVRTVPDSVRNALMDIIELRKNENSFSFNMTDALKMIRQQLDLSPDSFLDILFTFQLHHQPQGWVVGSQSHEKMKISREK
ncbi:MAG: acyltransferase [Bdellovibrionaceae bacterium]|nr:acyltransferase [Pseudobdellovibrionaceae bacterium]